MSAKTKRKENIYTPPTEKNVLVVDEERLVQANYVFLVLFAVAGHGRILCKLGCEALRGAVSTVDGGGRKRSRRVVLVGLKQLHYGPSNGGRRKKEKQAGAF